MKRITPKLICIISLFFTLSCKDDNEAHNARFVESWQMSSELYHADSIELAEIGMKRVESELLEIKGNPRLIGTSTKNDYLYRTRLRLWGIYYTQDNEAKLKEYRSLLEPQIEKESDEGLYSRFLESNQNWSPKWLKPKEEGSNNSE